MRSKMLRRLFGASVLAVLVGVVTAADPALSTATAGKAVEADIAHLNQVIELSKTKKVGGRVKATAMLLAVYAEENLTGKDGAKMATLRAEALKIAVAAQKKDMATAGTTAKGLTGLKADDTANAKAMKIEDLIKKSDLGIGEVMDMFGGSTGGGFNIEKDLREIKKNGVKSTDAVELLGARTAAIAAYTLELRPDAAKGPAKKDWDNWSMEMKKLSTDLATEAAKGKTADLAKLKKIATSLDANCTNCHNKFKD